SNPCAEVRLLPGPFQALAANGNVLDRRVRPAAEAGTARVRPTPRPTPSPPRQGVCRGASEWVRAQAPAEGRRTTGAIMTVRLEITAYSGFVVPPTVVVPQPQQATQSQGGPKRPTLRLAG